MLRSSAPHYWVTQRKGCVYLAPTIKVATWINPPNWGTNTPWATYINRNRVIFAFALFVLTLITACGFYCRNRNQSLIVLVPLSKERTEQRSGGHCLSLSLASTSWEVSASVGRTRCAPIPPQARLFCWRVVRRALTDQYVLMFLPVNGTLHIFKLLLHVMNAACLLEQSLLHYLHFVHAFKTFFTASRVTNFSVSKLIDTIDSFHIT